MEDFGSRFIESQGRPIEHDGRSVHMSHVLGPLPAGVLTIRMQAQGELEQGVGVSADGGWLTTNGTKGKRFELWSETAPDETAIDVRPLRGRESASVRVWNIWRHPRWGSTMAWVASAGILVESADTSSATLHASAGPGGPTFDDLVVEVGFRPE